MSLESHRWQRIQELFDDIVDQPEPRQAELLAHLGEEDEELREELKALLAAVCQAEDFLESPAIAAIAPGQVGPYRLLQMIGEGSSGTVYLATRADEAFRKRVAIKIVRPERVDEELLRRFKHERQILASLDHPYIAELYDGGSTEDGLPFFAMEYVEGLPLDEFCASQGLGVDERLRLFCKICQAVHHAHQRLVVHRDLKPNNLLVTAEGVPKLLDFGIAKLLNPEMMTSDLASTAKWYRPLTPHYASPEQAQGKLITTRSDVYSLGIVLYQLLTGQLPYRLTDRSLAEAERHITEFQPMAPSTKVREMKADSEVEALGLRPKALARRLSGDLDTIVLKALRKTPARRYGSVEQMAADVRRHLDDLPVLARKDSWSYRFGKWVSRNRLLAASVALFGTIVAMLMTSLVLQSGRLATERDEARRERDKGTVMLQFMRDVFYQADPMVSGAAEPTVLEVLDRSSGRLKELQDQPEIQVAMGATLAQIFMEQGRLDRAESLLRQALMTHQRITRPADTGTTELMGSLGILLRRQERYPEAEEIQRQTLELRRQIFGRGSLEEAWTYNDLAVVLRRQGHYSEAEDLHSKALAIFRHHFGPRHEQVALTLNNLANSLVHRHAFEAAEASYREALSIRRQTLGRDHLLTAFSETNLAFALVERRKLEEAIEPLAAGLKQLRRIFGAEHREVSTARVVQARWHRLQGDYETAEAILNEISTLHPQGDPLWPRLTAERVRLLLLQDRPAQAESLASAVLAHHRDGSAPNSPAIADSLDLLAEVLITRGAFEEAMDVQSEAYERLEAIYGRDHSRLAPSLGRLAVLQVQAGNLEAANRGFQKAEGLLQPANRRPDVWAQLLAHHGDTLAAAGRQAEAQALRQSALEELLKIWPEDHPRVRAMRDGARK